MQIYRPYAGDSGEKIWLKVVMQRIGAAEYIILGTVKGAELEPLRFTHPFMALTCRFRRSQQSPDAGVPRGTYRPGHGPDDFATAGVWPETANPVGPDGAYLPCTYPTLDRVNVFKANDSRY